MKISLIAALSENRVIGKDNKLIWYIPDDLKHFKEITQGHPVIMGRKTYESIGRHLPGRLNIIITREKNYNPHKFSSCVNCDDFRIKICNSLEEAIEIATKEEKEIFIIGGGQIFEQAISRADKLYLTIIEARLPSPASPLAKQSEAAREGEANGGQGEFEGDTFFPEYSEFKKTSESPVFEYNEMKYRFMEYEKKN